jgi:hypothetical protein
MVLDQSILSRYIHANPASPVIAFNPEKEYFVEDADGSLQLHAQQSGDIWVTGNKLIYTYCSCGQSYPVKLELSDETVTTVMQWELEQRQSKELAMLFPAALELIKHYNSVVDYHTDCKVKVYLLKDLAFYQEYKGTVIIVPIWDKETRDDLHVIKGYIASNNADDIRYETVQGWRYHQLQKQFIQSQTVEDLMNKLPDEWKEILWSR